MNLKLRLPTRAIALILAGALTVSCNPLGALTEQIDDSTSRLIAVLDDAIAELASANTDWQRIVQDALVKLPSDVQSTIRTEISDMLNRAIGAAGAELRCDVDFLGNRLRQQLIDLRARILGQPSSPREPQLCQVSPLAVDLGLEPNRRTRLDFFGYDFDTLPITATLVNGTNSVLVTDKLARPTHYHMTLNLGGNGVQFSSSSERLVLSWQGKEISTISVIQPSTPICRTRTLSVPIGKITYEPRLTRGDREFDGNGPRVTASVSLDVEHVGSGTAAQSRVLATYSMRAKETESDWTTGDGQESKIVFSSDAGERVERLITTHVDTLTYTDSDHNVDSFSRGNAGPVRTFEFYGDTDGDDVGRGTQMTVHFNDLRVVLTQTGNCVSQLAARSSQSRQQLSPTTLQRFQADLDRITPELQMIIGKPFR